MYFHMDINAYFITFFFSYLDIHHTWNNSSLFGMERIPFIIAVTQSLSSKYLPYFLRTDMYYLFSTDIALYFQPWTDYLALKHWTNGACRSQSLWVFHGFLNGNSTAYHIFNYSWQYNLSLYCEIGLIKVSWWRIFPAKELPLYPSL